MTRMTQKPMRSEQQRYVALLLVGLIISNLLAGCGGRVRALFSGDNATSGATNAQITGRMGSEEFGLSKQELVDYSERVESLIAQCMREAGFEYIAVDYNTVRQGMTADKILPGYSDEQFASEFGFGISTTYTGEPPQLSTINTPAKIGLGEQNAAIFAALAAADQIAYTRTLFGENQDATFAVSLEAENFSLTGGCTRKAIEKVFSPEDLNPTYINPHDLLYQQEERQVFAQFADCMSAKGFNYSFEQEIEPDLKQRLYSITHGQPVAALAAEAQKALKNLQTEELAIAAALVECGEP